MERRREEQVVGDKFVVPVGGDLSICSARNKALAGSNGMEFNKLQGWLLTRLICTVKTNMLF